LLSGRTSHSVDLSLVLLDSDLSVELSLLSLQGDDSSVERLATARSRNTLDNDNSTGLLASLGESLLGLDESVSGVSLLRFDGVLDSASVLLDSSLDLRAAALLLVNDNVSVGLGAVLDSSAPLSESLLSGSQLDSLLSDLELELSLNDLSGLNSPSSDLSGSATAALRNGVDSDLDDLASLGASSDSALENKSSSLNLDNSSVGLDLSVDLSNSTATAASASNNNLLGSLASAGSLLPRLNSKLDNLGFSSGGTSLGLEGSDSLLSDSELPLSDSGSRA